MGFVLAPFSTEFIQTFIKHQLEMEMEKRPQINTYLKDHVSLI